MRTVKISHVNVEELWATVKEEIRNHLCSLREKSIQTDRIYNNDIIPWFGDLEGKIHRFMQKPIHSDTEFLRALPGNEPHYLPEGAKHIKDIMAQLDIILPDTPNIRAALPVLITAYILKYRNGMNESTQLLIIQLAETKEKTGVDGLLGRLTLEDWRQKFNPLECRKIEVKKKSVLRSYYICLLFSELLDLPVVSHPYVSALLFEYLGGYATLFLRPDELEKCRIQRTNTSYSSLQDQRALSYSKMHLSRIVPNTNELEKERLGIEVPLFCLQMKLVLTQTRIDQASESEADKLISELEESLSVLELAHYKHWVEKGYGLIVKRET